MKVAGVDSDPSHTFCIVKNFDLCGGLKGYLVNRHPWKPSTACIRRRSPLPPPLSYRLIFGSPPFRVSRTTKSRRHPEGGAAGETERGGKSGIGTTNSDSGSLRGGKPDVVGRDRRVDVDLDRGCGAGVVGSNVGVDRDCGAGANCGSDDVRVRDVGVGGNAAGGGASDGGSCGGPGSGELLTAVLRLSFVAAPGHRAPLPQTVEYKIDLCKSEGSLEVVVFLGEVDYNL